MLSKKLNKIPQSKLATAAKKNDEQKIHDNNGFMYKADTTLKTKSFRLSEYDKQNLKNLTIIINKNSDRKRCTESRVIRGIINYVSKNIDKDLQKIMPYIKESF